MTCITFTLLEIYRVMKALVTHFAFVITNAFFFVQPEEFEKTVYLFYILENE